MSVYAVDTFNLIYVELGRGNESRVFDTLPNETKSRVYHHVWDLAGRPSGNPLRYGEEHAYDYMPRLSQAVKVVAHQFIRTCAPWVQTSIYNRNLQLITALKADRAQFEASVLEWKNEAKPGENRKEAAKRIMDAYDNPHLGALDLTNLGLRSIPEAIGVLNLTTLKLDSNDLKSIPAEIGSLSDLKYLFASRNNLATLPATVGKLQHLKSLELSGNKFKDLPACIFDLPSSCKVELHALRDSAAMARLTERLEQEGYKGPQIFINTIHRNRSAPSFNN